MSSREKERERERTRVNGKNYITFRYGEHFIPRNGVSINQAYRRSYRGHVLPESAVFSYVTSVSSAVLRTRDIPAGFYSMRELMCSCGSPVLSACDIILHFRGEIGGSGRICVISRLGIVRKK